MKLEWTQQNEHCWHAPIKMRDEVVGGYWIMRHKDIDFDHYTVEYEHIELDQPERLGCDDTLEAAQARAAKHEADAL